MYIFELRNETIKFVKNLDRVKKLKKLISKGIKYKCIGCGNYSKHEFKSKCCLYCGEDLIVTIESILEDFDYIFDSIIEPIKPDGINTMIFKEHNFKYCTCDYSSWPIDGKESTVTSVHTGDFNTECGMKWKLDRDHEILDQETENSRTYVCKRGYHIIIIKQTDEEFEKHKEEYMGSLGFFLRASEEFDDN